MNPGSVDFWLAGLSVLECPISVEDKKATLKKAISEAMGGSFDEMTQLPETGLDPFDYATARTFYRLVLSSEMEKKADADIG